jgi:hypothetical protein
MLVRRLSGAADWLLCLCIFASLDPMGEVRGCTPIHEEGQIHHYSLNPITELGEKVKGTFTQSTAGGNSTCPSFMINPQYRLRIHPATSAIATRAASAVQVKLSVRTGRDLPVNVMALWSQGQRVFELVHTHIEIVNILSYS